MTDVYLRFANGIQALRRRVEALTVARGGALGVAADPLPWQLATIERILGDTEIRHLISDEVGLGKTVQALMVINALRWQTPSHKTVIVTPEHLLPQWQEECWIRAHVAPAISGTGVAETPSEAPVLLVRPRDLMHNADIEGGSRQLLDPAHQDLLIVDEPQTMALDIIESIATLSRDYRQVLVLSATPRLGEQRWRDILLRMIEPQMAERAVLDNRSIDEVLADREFTAMIGLSKLETSPEAGAKAYSSAAVGRRIIRNSRTDWGNYLPSRKNLEIRVPVTTNERRMHDIAAQLLEGADPQGDMRAQPWTTARGLQRSARTARPILSAIADRGGEFGREAELLRRAMLNDPGDTRLEALLDLLSAQWTKQKNCTFIVVCGDNPTIDLLQVALPRYFPDLENRISVLRRQRVGEEESVTSLKEMLATLEPLLKRRHSLLLIGDWVQAGLNLHHVASDIVFYSLPWDMISVDQLIGRIDRLRSKAPRRGVKEEEVRIWRIVQDGSQEAAVADVLDEMGLFAAPLPPMPEHELTTLSAIIAKAAKNRKLPAAIPPLSSHSIGIASLMTDLDPWTTERSQKCYSAWKQQAIPSPAMNRGTMTHHPLRQAEDALRSWLRLMARAADFDFGSRFDVDDPSFRFWTLWYPRLKGANMSGKSPFDLPDTDRDHWLANHQPLLISRRDLPLPPRKSVRTDGGEATSRPLRFLDHGEPLHDALVEGYATQTVREFGRKRNVQEICVRLPTNHPAAAIGGQILITACVHDPFPDIWLPDLWSDAAQGILEQATSDVQKAQLLADRQRLMSRMKGFQRYVRLRRPACLHLIGSKLLGSAWQPIASVLVEEALKPLVRDNELRTWAHQISQKTHIVPKLLLKTGRDQQLRDLVQILHSNASADREALQDEIAERRNLVISDATALVRNRTEAARRRRAQVPDSAMRQVWEGQAAALERSAQMAELCAMEEVMLLERFRTSLMPPHDPQPVSVCLALIVRE